MNTQETTARIALRDAEADARTFPQTVAALMEAGYESYVIDFRRARATYYEPGGASVELETHCTHTPIAPALDSAALQIAIKEAQTLAPGYTYKGFCEKAASAGCAGYVVSFSGRRAVYFGRDAQTHVEHFPA